MSLDLYHAFHEIGLTGSITRAAERLFISQPAVSKALRQLEMQMGFPLFVRKPKGVELTAEGSVLFRHVDEAMRQIAAGERLAERLRHLEEGAVRVGMSHTLCRHWFLPWLRAFHARHPQLRIQLFNRTTPDTVRMLESGELDFGIVSKPEVLGELSFQSLFPIEDIFVTNRREQVPDAPIPLEEISRFPLMLLECGNTSRQQLERHFKTQNIPLTAEIEISSMDFLIEFAKIGLGVAAVVRGFVLEELASGELFEIPVFPPPGERMVGILSNGDHPQSQAAAAFIRFLREEKP